MSGSYMTTNPGAGDHAWASSWESSASSRTPSSSGGSGSVNGSAGRAEVTDQADQASGSVGVLKRAGFTQGSRHDEQNKL